MTSFITTRDEEHEHQMRERLASEWGFMVIKLPKYSVPDCYVTDRESILGWVELRYREDYNFSTFDTTVINVDKYENLLRWEKGTDIPSYFVVQYPERFCWIAIADIDPSDQRIMPRKNKAEGPDEMVIHIKMSALTTVPL